MTITADGYVPQAPPRRLPKGYDLAPPMKSKAELDEERRAAWLEKRRGRITASKFYLLLKKPKTKNATFTQTCLTYLDQVVAERLGSHKFEASAPSTRWGHDNEPLAVEAYQERVARTRGKVDYDPYRLVENKLYENVGGSPDALVGSVGILEIKCPYDPAVHIRNVTERVIPEEYLGQCLGHLMNDSAREWCDFVSFDPRLGDSPAALIALRIDRRTYAAQYELLRSRVKAATEYVEQKVKRLSRKSGVGGKVVLRGEES